MQQALVAAVASSSAGSLSVSAFASNAGECSSSCSNTSFITNRFGGPRNFGPKKKEGKTRQNFCSNGRLHSGLPVRAALDQGLEDEYSSGNSEESENGFPLFTPSFFQPRDNGYFESSTKGASNTAAAASSGGNRTGLYRTPITGGVQSATSAHDLPPPAVAVRNLMEQARYAHLCTIMSRMHHRRRGYPFGTLVEFATDTSGHPIFSMSPLAIHTRNLLADPRCTLVVQVPGWSGLGNARVTLFGDVHPLPADKQEWAHKHYTIKHQQGAAQQWGNFCYYWMPLISDIYFVGGFGTVAWVDVDEYETARPDVIAASGSEETLKELNTTFSRPIREMLSAETEIDDAALISIDSKGTDIRVRQGAKFNIQRLHFEEGYAVETLEQAKTALKKLLEKAIQITNT